MDEMDSDSDDSDRGGSSKPGVREVTDEIDYPSSSDSDDSMQSDSSQIVTYKSKSPCFAGNDFNTALHEILCAKGRKNKRGADGFQVVTRKTNHPGHRPIPRKGEYDPKMVARFSEIYRDYLYGLTGRYVTNFNLTPATHKYVSMLEFARVRDRVLSTMFERRPVIWDLMAGSAADAFSFLLSLDPQELVLCQRSVPDGEHDLAAVDASEQEYLIMCENMKSFLKAFEDQIDARLSGDLIQDPGHQRRRTHIKCKHILAENFIMSVPDFTEVDLVYLDPSWDDDQTMGGSEERKFEMEPTELFQRLETVIWGPIRRKQIKVGCYVIKTRWNWLKVQEYMQRVKTDFLAEYSVRAKPFRPKTARPGKYGAVKGVFHYMILTHRQYKTIQVNNSQLYLDLVYNNQPVWVDKTTFVRPRQPAYSDQNDFVKILENDPHDEARYLKIEPPAPLKERERWTQRPGPHETTTYKKEGSTPAAEKPQAPPVVHYDPHNRFSVLNPDDAMAALKTTGPGARPPRIPGGSTLKGILG
jgi:hypothetical protein